MIFLTSAYIVTLIFFLWSAKKDSESWITWWDQFSHPYSVKTQTIGVIFIIMTFVMLLAIGFVK